jgi:CUB domain
MTFIQFATESRYDNVLLYDGYDDITSSTVTTFTGETYQTPFLFYSTQQYVFIRFTSDGSVTRSGFNATYQSVTPSTSTTPTYTTTTTTGERCSRPRSFNCSSALFYWLHVAKINLAKLDLVWVLTRSVSNRDFNCAKHQFCKYLQITWFVQCFNFSRLVECSHSVYSN